MLSRDFWNNQHPDGTLLLTIGPSQDRRKKLQSLRPTGTNPFFAFEIFGSPTGTGKGTLDLRRSDDEIGSNGQLIPGWIKW